MIGPSQIRQGTHPKRDLGWWIRAITLAAVSIFTVVLTFVIYHAEPILKNRVVATLSARFHGLVQLSDFHVSVRNGFQVAGAGLKIFGPGEPNPQQPAVQPLIAVGEFRFGTDILNLLHTPMRIRRVYLKGLELNIPPREKRPGGFRGGKIKIYVDEFNCDQARLVIHTLRPGKLPIDFEIRSLRMKEIGPGQPLLFSATLVNPKPVGTIQSTGFFGPWQADDPRSSPVKGEYSFTNADLSTINGISGILSSTGAYGPAHK